MRALQLQSAHATGHPAAAAAGRHQQRPLPAAASQRHRQRPRGATITAAGQSGQDRKARVPDAPPAGQPKAVKVELFETQGADGAAPDSLLAALLSSVDTSEPTSFDGEEKTE